MQDSQIPTKFSIPFANTSAYKNTIPLNSTQTQAASFATGFPGVNFTAIGAGGIPNLMQDFNGILNEVTAWQQWQAAGNPVPFDNNFQNAIGGYPFGAILSSATNPIPYNNWLSLTDNNFVNPDIQQLLPLPFGSIPSPWIAIPGIIDSPVTYTVGGTGANFVDLNVALSWLSQFKISQNGNVTFNLVAPTVYGGSVTVEVPIPGQGFSQQFITSSGNSNPVIVIDHPNANRIIINGLINYNAFPFNLNVYFGGISGFFPSNVTSITDLYTHVPIGILPASPYVVQSAVLPALYPAGLTFVAPVGYNGPVGIQIKTPGVTLNNLLLIAAPSILPTMNSLFGIGVPIIFNSSTNSPILEVLAPNTNVQNVTVFGGFGNGIVVRDNGAINVLPPSGSQPYSIFSSTFCVNSGIFIGDGASIKYPNGTQQGTTYIFSGYNTNYGYQLSNGIMGANIYGPSGPNSYSNSGGFFAVDVFAPIVSMWNSSDGINISNSSCFDASFMALQSNTGNGVTSTDKSFINTTSGLYLYVGQYLIGNTTPNIGTQPPFTNFASFAAFIQNGSIIILKNSLVQISFNSSSATNEELSVSIGSFADAIGITGGPSSTWNFNIPVNTVSVDRSYIKTV